MPYHHRHYFTFISGGLFIEVHQRDGHQQSEETKAKGRTGKTLQEEIEEIENTNDTKVSF